MALWHFWDLCLRCSDAAPSLAIGVWRKHRLCILGSLNYPSPQKVDVQHRKQCLSSGILGRCLIHESGIPRTLLAIRIFMLFLDLDSLLMIAAAFTGISAVKQSLLSQHKSVSSGVFIGLREEHLFVHSFFLKSGKKYFSMSFLPPSNACFYLPGIISFGFCTLQWCIPMPGMNIIGGPKPLSLPFHALGTVKKSINKKRELQNHSCHC